MNGTRCREDQLGALRDRLFGGNGALEDQINNIRTSLKLSQIRIEKVEELAQVLHNLPREGARAKA